MNNKGLQQQEEAETEINSKMEKIYQEELQKVINAVHKIGAQQLIQVAKQNNGYLEENILKKIFMQEYGFYPSANFNTFISILVSQVGYIQIDELLQKLNFDHKRHVEEQNLIKQLGLGNKSVQQGNQRIGGAKDVNKAQRIRQVLLDLCNQNYKQLADIYYPVGMSPLIDLEIFVQKTKAILSEQGQQIPNDFEIQNLFNCIDVNSGGSLTYSEFEQYFVDDHEQIVQTNKNQKGLALTKDLEQQIYQLFRQVDINDDKQIQIDELNNLLAKIGINASNAELEEYMRRYDKNNDGTISFDEFKIIMQEKIKNEMMTAETIIDELKREFKKVDIDNSRLLNIVQLQQVFKNLGVVLTQPELEALFKEIDFDGSKTVDIDEMILFITRNSEGTSLLAQTAILNIRSSRKFSIKDLMETFKQMPNNFRLSFFRSLHQKGMNYPSSSLKPKLNEFQIYPDLHYDNSKQISVSQSVFDYNYNCPSFFAELNLKQCNGVPIPQEQTFPRERISKRQIYISFFDSGRNQFIGNTCAVEAFWTQQYEDRWSFVQKNREDNIVYLKFDNYDKNKHANLNICVELVIHYIPQTQNSNIKNDLQISISFVTIPLNNLIKDGTYNFNLQGGEPSKPAVIDPNDIRTNRQGWRSVVKAMSKKIDSQIVFQLNTRLQNKTDQNQMAIMPSCIVLKKPQLPLFAVYREYFGYKSICKKEIDTTLSSNIVFKTFCRIIDCPDTRDVVCDFWKNEVLTRISKFEDILNAFQQAMNHFYILLSHDKFQFQNSDPTASVFCFKNQSSERIKLLQNCLEDIRILIGLKQGNPTNLKIQDNQIPFTIDELIEDDDEESELMIK
ncbi:hypothetical protein IMG5_092660 [Ichthyophthirius multifiliis]|uniref:EF-hand domain-containing protein n=1 Tax=Ichthyophthirius multifiliis TaxID=5932 RepID=G0QRG4_ICHMU|nr:hypothetical protein IMG5_092660 [Ichthyophthirius multifiliis]EGR32199.1 hypothetical protein IMG5_092660 [Ichthyophthirius multifiliis]|eukprot:XP_004035685.1 hypothetical protein IMG5_092660 [Ichthyophthirius multifiliis]